VEQQTLRLRKDHHWKASPGYAIFVLNRGDVRFDYPEDWVIQHEQGSVKFHDREPPQDNCVLEVSCGYLAPIDWSGLPLRFLLAATTEDLGETLERKAIVEERRGSLEIAWQETRFMDPREKRPAISRALMGRDSGIQCLITLAFWVDDEARLDPVWSEVVRSLVLGWYVQDPTRGPAGTGSVSIDEPDD